MFGRELNGFEAWTHTPEPDSTEEEAILQRAKKESYWLKVLIQAP
jgi:hypothetical protein